jgi:hypothetical protein
MSRSGPENTKGVIRGIHTDITEEEMAEELGKSKYYTVVSVKRLSRNGQNTEKIATTTVLIEFKGTTLPRSVCMYNVSRSVQVYVPKPTICFNCHLYGHIANQCKSPRPTWRCQMPLNIIKSVAYVWWGADPSCLLLIYKALILSKLQNSSFLWQQAPKKALHKLDVVQNIALRKILGVLPSTPIHSMLADTKLMPLKYVAMREADNLIINLMLAGDHTALNNIKELMQREETNPSTSNLQSLTRSFRKWSTSGLRLRQITHAGFSTPQHISEIILDTPWTNFQKQNLPPQTLQLILSCFNREA